MSAPLLAGIAVALAVLVLRPAPGPPTGGRGRPAVRATPGTAARTRRALGPVAVVVLLGLTLGSGRILVLACVAAALVLASRQLVRRARATRLAAGHRARVVELCDALQAELAAGQTAGQALGRAAEEWPLIAPAARAAATGGDVTRALRDLATAPGTASLRVVAAAWLVSHRTGHGLGDALGRVADDLRATEQTRRVVAGELASARATARLLAGLPLLALALGSGAGAAPWAFLLGSPAGLGCLAAGLGLGYAGLVWVEALARDVDRGA